MTAMPPGGARHGGEGPRLGPRDDEEDLPWKSCDPFDKDLPAFTSGHWRAGQEAQGLK